MALVGLENIGNTCYIIAALQCLVQATRVIQDYFLGKQVIKKVF